MTQTLCQVWQRIETEPGVWEAPTAQHVANYTSVGINRLGGLISTNDTIRPWKQGHRSAKSGVDGAEITVSGRVHPFVDNFSTDVFIEDRAVPILGILKTAGFQLLWGDDPDEVTNSDGLSIEDRQRCGSLVPYKDLITYHGTTTASPTNALVCLDTRDIEINVNTTTHPTTAALAEFLNAHPLARRLAHFEGTGTTPNPSAWVGALSPGSWAGEVFLHPFPHSINSFPQVYSLSMDIQETSGGNRYQLSGVRFGEMTFNFDPDNGLTFTAQGVGKVENVLDVGAFVDSSEYFLQNDPLTYVASTHTFFRINLLGHTDYVVRTAQITIPGAVTPRVSANDEGKHIWPAWVNRTDAPSMQLEVEVPPTSEVDIMDAYDGGTEDVSRLRLVANDGGSMQFIFPHTTLDKPELNFSPNEPSTATLKAWGRKAAHDLGVIIVGSNP